MLTPGANLLANHFVTAQYPGANRLAYGSYLTAARCRLMSKWPGVRLESREDLVLEPAAADPVQVQVDGEVVGQVARAYHAQRCHLHGLDAQGLHECLA